MESLIDGLRNSLFSNLVFGGWEKQEMFLGKKKTYALSEKRCNQRAGGKPIYLPVPGGRVLEHTLQDGEMHYVWVKRSNTLQGKRMQI